MFWLAYFPFKKHQTFVNRRECSKTQQQQTQWNISLGCWNRKPKWFFLAASYTSKEILPLSCNTLCQELFSFCNLVSVHCNVHHTWKFHAFVGLKQSPHFFSKFAVLNCGFTWLTPGCPKQSHLWHMMWYGLLEEWNLSAKACILTTHL